MRVNVQPKIPKTACRQQDGGGYGDMTTGKNRKCFRCKRQREPARKRGGGYRYLCPVCNKDELELYGMDNLQKDYHKGL